MHEDESDPHSSEDGGAVGVVVDSKLERVGIVVNVELEMELSSSASIGFQSREPKSWIGTCIWVEGRAQSVKIVEGVYSVCLIQAIKSSRTVRTHQNVEVGRKNRSGTGQIPHLRKTSLRVVSEVGSEDCMGLVRQRGSVLIQLEVDLFCTPEGLVVRN